MRFKTDILGPGIACVPVVREHQEDFQRLPERVQRIIGENLYHAPTLLNQLFEVYGNDAKGEQDVKRVINMLDRRVRNVRKILQEMGMTVDPHLEIKMLLEALKKR